MVTIKIDGKTIKCEKDRFILEVARENGIEIPTLCYDPNLEIFGGCRLCIVEVIQRGRKKSKHHVLQEQQMEWKSIQKQMI
ncbi:MAG: 2Fe-2S iron-sulfur cluster-binding protein [Tissierellia bacterium]|nr:2Fe-2S iron-sulfur cluster-binding protein [Tissierellia bacterium]